MLPGKSSTMDPLKRKVHKLTKGKLFTKGPMVDEPDDFLGEKNDEDRDNIK